MAESGSTPDVKKKKLKRFQQRFEKVFETKATEFQDHAKKTTQQVLAGQGKNGSGSVIATKVVQAPIKAIPVVGAALAEITGDAMKGTTNKTYHKKAIKVDSYLGKQRMENEKQYNTVVARMAYELSYSYEYQLVSLSSDTDLDQAAEFAVKCVFAYIDNMLQGEMKDENPRFSEELALKAVLTKNFKTNTTKLNTVYNTKWNLKSLFLKPGLRKRKDHQEYNTFKRKDSRPKKYGYRNSFFVWDSQSKIFKCSDEDDKYVQDNTVCDYKYMSYVCDVQHLSEFLQQFGKGEKPCTSFLQFIKNKYNSDIEILLYRPTSLYRDDKFHFDNVDFSGCDMSHFCNHQWAILNTEQSIYNNWKLTDAVFVGASVVGVGESEGKKLRDDGTDGDFRYAIFTDVGSSDERRKTTGDVKDSSTVQAVVENSAMCSTVTDTGTIDRVDSHGGKRGAGDSRREAGDNGRLVGDNGREAGDSGCFSADFQTQDCQQRKTNVRSGTKTQSDKDSFFHACVEQCKHLKIHS